MNMQDVTNLAISEGDVRTIHDSSNNLLWGKLSYETKYAGDTFQQTYTGKNLIDFSTVSYSSVNSGSATRNGTAYTVIGNDYDEYGGITFAQSNLKLKTNTTYTASALVVSTTSTSGSVIFCTSSYNTSGSGITSEPGKAGDRISITFTTGASISNNAEIRLFPSMNATAVYDELMIEESSTLTSYEQYVGGIPAPNPDYPQAVQTVTGEQTVTVGDVMNSESFTVNLGSIELCKIGTYQDYIYKSGDDWYVHKEIYKKTFNGSESWQSWPGALDQNNTRAARLLSANISPSVIDIDNTQMGVLVSDSFTDTTQGDLFSNDVEGIASTLSNIYIRINKTTIGESGAVGDFKNWLTSNNVIVYYVLATATDTKITDNTLIGQLDAVHEWLTRYGYNSTVSGTLPLIIELTNLS